MYDGKVLYTDLDNLTTLNFYNFMKMQDIANLKKNIFELFDSSVPKFVKDSKFELNEFTQLEIEVFIKKKFNFKFFIIYNYC
jgi:hypothetical protein